MFYHPTNSECKSSSWGLAPSRFATANLGKLCHLLYKQKILHPSHKESSHDMYLLTNGWISRETIFRTQICYQPISVSPSSKPKPPTLNIGLWKEIMGRLHRGVIGSKSHTCRIWLFETMHQQEVMQNIDLFLLEFQ